MGKTGQKPTSRGFGTPAWATPLSVSWKPKPCLSARSGRRRLPQLEMARALLAAEPELAVQCDLMLAECHRQIGHEEQRLSALLRAAEGFVGSDAARIELANMLARSGKRDQAVIVLLPLAVRNPEWRVDLVRLLLDRAIHQPRDQRNWGEVEAHLREAEQTLPGSVESLALLRVDVLAAQGRLDEARAHMMSVQAQDPQNVSYRLALARMSQRHGEGDNAWANRARIALLLQRGRAADQDRALALVDQNLGIDRDNSEDLTLKATILALRPDRQSEAVTILQRLRSANRLGDNERFLLAQIYLVQGDDVRYQGEMQTLTHSTRRSPRYLAHFIDYLIGRDRLDQAERWLAELKQAEPKGLLALERETQLLDLRHHKTELRAMLMARSRDFPDQIDTVAKLLDRYGFAEQAEAAFKSSIGSDPSQPERFIGLAQFLARQDRVSEAMDILRKAWSSGMPAG